MSTFTRHDQLPLWWDANLIYADPPWDFQNWSGDQPGMVHDRQRGANKHYPTMTTDQLCALQVPAAKHAILIMWRVSSHEEDALRVARAWGFTPMTKAWTWLKLTKDGRPKMGMGYYLRQCTEDAILCVRGEPGGVAVHDELAFIESIPGAHSEKPDEAYTKIERLFPHLTRRLEMFARRQHPGWVVFGNQVENSIEISEGIPS